MTGMRFEATKATAQAVEQIWRDAGRTASTAPVQDAVERAVQYAKDTTSATERFVTEPRPAEQDS